VAQEPAIPRPAATIILLRRGGRHSHGAVEVLLGKRHSGASFMPDVWVFPGGVVETEGADAREPGSGELDAEELAHRACAIRELEEETGVVLPADAELFGWSRWITPEFVPARFDTRFYIARAPAHATLRADEREIVEVSWLAPQSALDSHYAGAMQLVFPTIRHLQELAAFKSTDEVLQAARKRSLEPVIPRVAGEGEERRVVLPGDPGYD
jgi:8-oxo-dGTP pyrophosphatase MutT (NUDIX family)